MKNIAITLLDMPGELARMGEALGRARVSVEGGAAFAVNGVGHANFLVEDGDAARVALEAAGIRVVAVQDVLIQRLDQSRPGQLGLFTRKLAEAGVNVGVLYSDHANQLIVVVDDMERGRQVSEAWMAGSVPAVSGQHASGYFVARNSVFLNDDDNECTRDPRTAGACSTASVDAVGKSPCDGCGVAPGE